MRLPLLFAIVFGMAGPSVLPAEDSIDDRLKALDKLPGVVRSHLGVTRKGTRIPCLYAKDDLDLHSRKARVLFLAGFQDGDGTQRVLDAMDWFYTSEDAKSYRESFTLSVVPLVNPDNIATFQLPPKGDAYFSKTNAEGEYLWRWIAMHAPDLVVVIKNRDATKSATPFGELQASITPPTGKIALGMNTYSEKREPTDQFLASVEKYFRALKRSKLQPSAARRELQKRVDRKPLEIAKQLAKVYGHDLSSVQYIPALALVGRLRLGELTSDPSHREDVERIVKPYFDGSKASLPKKFSGSHLSGHLVFAELARMSENQEKKARYLELARAAANTGFDAAGKMKSAMPAHNEMSDAVFMGCPILVEAGVLANEGKYLDMADRHFDFMKKLVLRPDGVYRHSPLCETAWGRGNGFPALGLAWSLSALPKNHPLHETYLKEFQNHIAALVKHQDPNGMWHQVIDDDASYRELSCTCMITYAMIRGVRKGWLSETEYRPVIENAFRAIKMRIAEDAALVDVCTGTGKQKSLRDYYDRKAILGKDPRGGAMALLVTTEMARFTRGDEN